MFVIPAKAGIQYELDFIQFMAIHSRLKMKKLAVILLLFVAVLFLVQLAVNGFLADYVASRMIPQTATNAGIDQAAADIVKVGLFESVAGPVRLGEKKRPFLDIAVIKIRYTPWGLLKKHIQQVHLSGVTVNAGWGENGLVLPGFSPPPNRSGTDNKETNDTVRSWPVSIGRVVLDNAVVNLARGKDRFHLPLALTLTATDRTMQTIDGTLQLFPHDRPTTLNGRLKTAADGISARLTVPSTRLDALNTLVAHFPGLDLSGTADLSAQAHINVNPWQLNSAAMELTLSDAGIAFQNLVIQSVDEQMPITFTALGSPEAGWRVVETNAVLVSPLSLKVSRLDCFLASASEAGTKQGTFKVALDPADGQPEKTFSLLSPAVMEGTVKVEFPGDHGRRLLLTGDKPDPAAEDCRVRVGDVVITAPVPEFSLSVEEKNGRVLTRAQLALDRAAAAMKDETINVKNVTLRPSVDISPAMDGNIRAAGHLRLSTGEITLPQQSATIAETAVELPFHWPADDTNESGRINLGPLSWRRLDLGALSGSLQQAGMGVAIAGSYATDLLPGLTADLSGKIGPGADRIEGEMHCRLRHRPDGPDIDLGRFADKAAGTTVNGDLAATIDVSLGKGGPSARLDARIDQGQVRSSEKGMSITGIRAGLNIPDLSSMRSRPAQNLSFTEAAFGDIRFTDGNVDFQLEPSRTLFVEKGGFKWCQGSVYLESMRLSPDTDEYNLILYSDRLNLAEVLSQIGTIQAQGAGTVSGRIPLRYAGGDISVDNGFLFSAPGEGGTINLHKTDVLTAGLPKQSQQYRQIDLAREALKSYHYDWAKVLLNSEGENLHIQLSFDGRPTRSLPFVYDKKEGGFVRVAEDKQLSEFKGLSLDVNFTIPLNQLIGYKGIWGM